MEEKTLDEIAAEMRGREDLNGGDLVDNFDIAAGEYGGFDALQLIHAYGECLDRAIRREREAFQKERDDLTDRLAGAKNSRDLWSNRADELRKSCDKYYAVAGHLKQLVSRLCDGLDHIYEREGIDYGTGEDHKEARKYLAELNKGGSAVAPSAPKLPLKRVWLVVETSHEICAEEDTKIAHVCTSPIRAQELLEQDGAFITNLPDSSVNPNRIKGRNDEWEYDYYVMEMEVKA